MAQFEKTLVWFRRDLRSFDHAALHHALTHSRQVYCVFIYDRDILDSLPRSDRRVEFIHESIRELAQELDQLGGALITRQGVAAVEIALLAAELGADAVCVNRDYEPKAVERDAVVAACLKRAGRAFLGFKDQVIFDQNEILSRTAKPFTIFTPYKNAWLKKLQTTPVPDDEDFYIRSYPIDTHKTHFARPDHCLITPLPTLAALGFEKTNLSDLPIPTGMSGGAYLLDEFLPRMPDYRTTRDFPAAKGPSYLSVHLRFGTVSVRALARRAIEAIRSGEGTDPGADANARSAAKSSATGKDPSGPGGSSTWLSELIWRDFYFMILHFNPRVVDRPFKPEYERIEWETGAQARALFAAWCEGRTGYPLVDAAMTQINQTGYMHNRLRMVTACFLIKDLGIDWRLGERYFAEKLNDYDLSANNGGWQWAASSGCDAQPYFRIFNPVTQSEKFDREGQFIRRYVPQLSKLTDRQIHAPWLHPESELHAAGIVLGSNYPHPVVIHAEARDRTLNRYQVVKK